jgi:hypothetical protein
MLLPSVAYDIGRRLPRFLVREPDGGRDEFRKLLNRLRKWLIRGNRTDLESWRFGKRQGIERIGVSVEDPGAEVMQDPRREPSFPVDP